MANRRRFYDLAEIELARAARRRHRVALLLFDVDEFKCINDLFGHAVGDEVLRQFARACGSQLRPYDILGRIGGDEFAILLPDTDASAALTIAERLRACIAAGTITNGAFFVAAPTISIGVASVQACDGPLAALLGLADRAMYGAKSAGRNRVRVTVSQ
jgi:diguanylate cyclase (GGDEF)-like protein